MKRIALAASLLTAFAVPVSAEPQSYRFDKAHTNILFFIDHLGFSQMEGEFRDFDGELRFDPENPAASSVKVSIKTASVSTDVPDLDKHLQTPDFFNAAQHPTLDFASTAVEQVAPGRLRVDGNLTLLGVSKPVTLDVTVHKTGPHPFTKAPAAGFGATATIKRSDFGMNYMLGMLGEEVAIRIETEAQAAR